MKCPYSNPTIAQCEQCPFDDCVRDERQDHNEYNRRWDKEHPERRRATRYKYFASHKESKYANYKEWYKRLKQDTVRMAEFREKKKLYMREKRARLRERQAV